MGSGIFNGKWTVVEKQNKKIKKNLVASGLGKVFAAAGEREGEPPGRERAGERERGKMRGFVNDGRKRFNPVF